MGNSLGVEIVHPAAIFLGVMVLFSEIKKLRLCINPLAFLSWHGNCEGDPLSPPVGEAA